MTLPKAPCPVPAFRWTGGGRWGAGQWPPLPESPPGCCPSSPCSPATGERRFAGALFALKAELPPLVVSFAVLPARASPRGWRGTERTGGSFPLLGSACYVISLNSAFRTTWSARSSPVSLWEECVLGVRRECYLSDHISLLPHLVGCVREGTNACADAATWRRSRPVINRRMQRCLEYRKPQTVINKWFTIPHISSLKARDCFLFSIFYLILRIWEPLPLYCAKTCLSNICRLSNVNKHDLFEVLLLWMLLPGFPFEEPALEASQTRSGVVGAVGPLPSAGAVGGTRAGRMPAPSCTVWPKVCGCPGENCFDVSSLWVSCEASQKQSLGTWGSRCRR